MEKLEMCIRFKPTIHQLPTLSGGYRHVWSLVETYLLLVHGKVRISLTIRGCSPYWENMHAGHCIEALQEGAGGDPTYLLENAQQKAREQNGS